MPYLVMDETNQVSVIILSKVEASALYSGLNVCMLADSYAHLFCVLGTCHSIHLYGATRPRSRDGPMVPTQWDNSASLGDSMRCAHWLGTMPVNNLSNMSASYSLLVCGAGDWVEVACVGRACYGHLGACTLR